MKVSSQQITVRQLFNGRSPIATLKDATDLAFGVGRYAAPRAP